MKNSNENRKASLEAYSYLNSLVDYINQGGRFFFGSDKSRTKEAFDILKDLLPELKKEIPKEKVYYRARISNEKTGHYNFNLYPKFEGYSPKELGAPPSHIANDGRVNPKGISYLYLADSEICALSETRPTIASTCVVGEGKIKRDISLISFISKPYYFGDVFTDAFIYYIDLLYSSPLNGLHTTEYMPSQAVSEFIKSEGYDGVEYNSSQHKSGRCLALFNTNDWSATSSVNYDIDNINYEITRSEDKYPF